METKKKVAVIGAGLAGLAAAYELSKDDRVHVELFEKNDYVGGRVCSLDVAGQPVDFGGFIVYPWYEQFHRIVGELRIEDALDPIPLKNIYYDVDGDHTYRIQKDLDFPVSHTMKLYPKMALGVLTEDDMAAPDLEKFKDRTIREHFRKILGVKHETLYERYTDIVCQGYCYGPVDQYKMSFVAPIIRFQRLYGDISKAFYFAKGTSVLTGALREAIERNGAMVHTNTAVTALDNNTVTTSNSEQEFDRVVLALPANDPLYAQVLSTEEVGCTYTHFYTITVQADGTPLVDGVKDWGAVFHRPEAHVPYQILSSIHLGSLYGKKLDGYFNFNVVVRDELVQEKDLSEEEMFKTLLPQLKALFPDVSWQACVQLKHWSVTMPISQESFVARVREEQGIDGRYFAGDYLGAPSMETAVTTGVRAAQMLLTDLEKHTD